MNLNDNNLERFPAFPGDRDRASEEVEPAEKVFRKSRLSYVTLLFLLIVFPALSIVSVGDPKEALEQLSAHPIYLVYIPTIIIQWFLFLLVFLTTRHERTGLGGIGFKKIRVLDFFWAAAFLLVSNLLLSLIAVVLSWLNMEIPGEIGLILPKNSTERILWVILSLTAAVCEETAYRGYLITRLKILGKFKGWIIPVVVSSLAFGSGHGYQGIGGLVLITIYGVMFALLYLGTGRMWPVIIAHFFQDFSALFFPYPE